MTPGETGGRDKKDGGKPRRRRNKFLYRPRNSEGQAPSGLLSNFFLLTPVRRGARGHNCMAQFGPSGNYNSNCDKNGIEEVFTTYYKSWLDNQIRRIFTIMTPGATGGKG
jgi:hypothetical protein